MLTRDSFYKLYGHFYSLGEDKISITSLDVDKIISPESRVRF